MTELPPLPSWDGLHPLVVHFPIALLLIAPLFVLLGVALSRGRPFLWAALLLMVIGTAGTFFAVSTGEAAGKLAERTPQINAVLEHHEQLAERTRAGFAALTAIFAVILLLPAAFRRKAGRLSRVVAPLLFLVFYGAVVVLLVNTAHNGGRLVHELGVQALVAPAPAPAGEVRAGHGGD
jgi:uncharacterized membrane protein